MEEHVVPASERQIGGSYYKSLEVSPYKFFLVNKITHQKAAIIRRLIRYDKPNGQGKKDLAKIMHECDLIEELDPAVNEPIEKDSDLNYWKGYVISPFEFITANRFSPEIMKAVLAVLRYDHPAADGKKCLDWVRGVVTELKASLSGHSN